MLALSGGQLFTPIQMLAGFEETDASLAAQQAYRRGGDMMRLGIAGFVVRKRARVIAVDCGTPGAVVETVES